MIASDADKVIEVNRWVLGNEFYWWLDKADVKCVYFPPVWNSEWVYEETLGKSTGFNYLIIPI